MSSLPSQAHGAASRTANSTWLEHLTRGGLVGYGIIHLLFAWLILQIAFDGSATDGDQSGALHKLAEEPFGTFLIVVIIVGLIAMAIWQLLEAAVGHRAERGRHRLYERIVSAGRAPPSTSISPGPASRCSGARARPAPTPSSRPART